MNERIFELIKQATVSADQVENYAKSEGLIVPDEKLDVAKFAELIVRECSQISRDHQRNYYESHGDRIAKKIKEHFGVEE